MLNYTHIFKQVNTSLYDLEREKEEVLTYIKMAELNQFDFDKILCLVGPPGVGKKSLAYAWAHAMGRRYVHIPIGINEASAGVSTYGKSKIGEIAGQIIHLMNQYRDQTILFLLEGFDFLSLTFQNKIAYRFKEVLAITHDHALRMKHIESPLDFRRALFFATATDVSRMSQDLLSQLEIIPMMGYTDEQKIAIVRGWILPEDLRACGLQEQLRISDDTLYELIKRYTNEIGLKQLCGVIKKLCKRVVFELALSEGNPIPELTSERLTCYLGVLAIEYVPLVLWATAAFLPSMAIKDGFLNLLIVAAIFGVVNALIRPVAKLLTLPLRAATLGLFTLIVNGSMVVVTAWISDLLELDGGIFKQLLVGTAAALIISLISTVLSFVLPDGGRD